MDSIDYFGCPECGEEQEVNDFQNFKCKGCEIEGRVAQCETCTQLLWLEDENIMCDACLEHRLDKY